VPAEILGGLRPRGAGDHRAVAVALTVPTMCLLRDPRFVAIGILALLIAVTALNGG